MVSLAAKWFFSSHLEGERSWLCHVSSRGGKGLWDPVWEMPVSTWLRKLCCLRHLQVWSECEASGNSPGTCSDDWFLGLPGKRKGPAQWPPNDVWGAQTFLDSHGRVSPRKLCPVYPKDSGSVGGRAGWGQRWQVKGLDVKIDSFQTCSTCPFWSDVWNLYRGGIVSAIFHTQVGAHSWYELVRNMPDVHRGGSTLHAANHGHWEKSQTWALEPRAHLPRLSQAQGLASESTQQSQGFPSSAFHRLTCDPGPSMSVSAIGIFFSPIFS